MVAREPLPGFVHEAAALVEEAAAVFVDHDAVGIDQHHRRGILAARIDRLGMHAVPVARTCRRRAAVAIAMPSPVLKRVPGEISRIVSRARPEMLAHHLAVALETATGEHDGVGGQRLARAALLDDKTGDAAVFAGDLARGAAVTKRHAGLLGRPRQRLDEGRPAADRLDARRTFRQIVARLNELDAVRGDPGHGRRCVLRRGGRNRSRRPGIGWR